MNSLPPTTLTVRTAKGNDAINCFRDRRALAAYRRRLPEAIELARTINMARLEVETQYKGARHDQLFAEFGASGLDTQEMAHFPDYLVCVDAAQVRGAEHDALMEILSAGLPMNILVQSNDIVEEREFGRSRNLNVGSGSRQLTSAAIGLNEVFVLQASNSHLYQFRDHLLNGLSGVRPALFSVFSGDNDTARQLPPYLVAAAAMESRAFPAFAYDPRAGKTWADRFSVDRNPQVHSDWPVHHFTYEDPNPQRVETDVAFTLADFLACDRRFKEEFSGMPSTAWNSSLAPVADCLNHNVQDIPERIPAIMMIDREDSLHEVIVDANVMAATRSCRDAWRSLRELGGVHNSHAERLFEQRRQEWEEQAPASRAVPASNISETERSVVQVAEPLVKDDAEPELSAEPVRSTDEPYFETPQCTTCHECIQINDKMFAYNDNGQAYVADPDAGIYREMVEAAENCQVAIIHPG